jgi:hypothetical protein
MLNLKGLSTTSLRLAAAGIGVCALLAIAHPAHAYTYSSEAQYAEWSSDGYTVYNDVWGNSNPSQWLNINSYSSWNIVSDQTGGGVKSYGNVSYFPDQTISSSASDTASFNCSLPSGAQYDNSFDCWTANNEDEIMIWENWTSGVGPIGSEKYSSQSIGGSSWNVYQGSDGHNCVSFLRTSQRTSGTENVMAIIEWAKSKGLISGSELTTVGFGFEVTSTNGWQTFTMNDFSASW